MKTLKKSLMGLVLVSSLFLCSCGGTLSSAVTSNESSASTSTTTSSATSTSTGKTSSGTNSSTSTATTSVSTTSIDSISSGSATVSFSGTNKTISAAYLIDGVNVSITSGTYSSASSSANQVVFLVINGGSLSIVGSSSNYVSITKTGSAASNGQVSDDYNFYGINSAIVVAGSTSSATLSYVNINSSSNGSNAVVSTVNASVNISNSTITTTGSAGSRGLHATYSGSITADNVSITTSGASCASLATDRGGGTVTASNMTLTTNGAGSPLVYSTGTISVTSSTGTANGAQMVVVEGGSTAKLDSCTFSATGKGNRSGTSEVDTSTHTVDAAGIFIYQSMSGDAASGTDYFTAKNSTLTVSGSNIPMFYCTNITANITLNNNSFTFNNTYFLVAEATSAWGTSGRNGATVVMNLTSQSLSSYSAYTGSTSSISGGDFGTTV